MTTVDVLTDKADRLHQKALDAWQHKDMASACMQLRAAIALNPDVAAYHANLGVMLKAYGDIDERIACYRRAIELDPNEPAYHANFASACNGAGRVIEAESAIHKALAIDSKRPESWFNLGIIFASLGRQQEAGEAFESAVEYRPGWIEAINKAADCWRTAGDWTRTALRFRDALGVSLSDANPITRRELLLSLAHALMQNFRHTEAEACYRQALSLSPSDADLLNRLGNVLKAQEKFDEAETVYRRVIILEPNMAAGYVNLGTVSQSLGWHSEAISLYRKALEKDSTIAAVWGNLGNCLTYSIEHDGEEVLATLRGYDRSLAQSLRDNHPHTNDCDPWRRLRIGYVGSDFRRHSVGYFALPLIEGHRRDNVEIHCYYSHRQNDDWTLRFRAAASGWNNVVDLNDAELARRIRADRIDILVDTSGHTEGNRLLTFARKPAPVQVTWMGYVTTTGMSAMDWRITHGDADPPGAEAHYAERLWRLPGTMWCWRPLSDMPSVKPPPFARKGYVTFGSFNRYSKNSSRVLAAWAEIMKRVPDSRLVICVPRGKIREEMARIFSEYGVAPERIHPFDKVDHTSFWALHGEVDIALDSFPFGGGATTCESLWMGVPLVTVTGSANAEFSPRFASRMGYAFLNSIGLPELAAETVAGYVEIAAGLAHDSDRLTGLRQTLRDRMAAAPLTDESRFVDEMENAYRAMWLEWCGT